MNFDLRSHITPFNQTIHGYFGDSLRNETIEALELHVNLARRFKLEKCSEGTKLIRRQELPRLQDLAACEVRNNLNFFGNWEDRERDKGRFNLFYRTKIHPSGKPRIPWGTRSTEEQQAVHQQVFNAIYEYIRIPVINDSRLARALFPRRMLNAWEKYCLTQTEEYFNHINWRLNNRPQIPLAEMNPSLYLFLRFKIVDTKLNSFVMFQHEPINLLDNELCGIARHKVDEMIERKLERDRQNESFYHWNLYPGVPRVIEILWKPQNNSHPLNN